LIETLGVTTGVFCGSILVGFKTTVDEEPEAVEAV
jgi:hypothetical protein